MLNSKFIETISKDEEEKSGNLNSHFTSSIFLFVSTLYPKVVFKRLRSFAYRAVSWSILSM